MNFKKESGTGEIHPPAEDIAEHAKIRKREMAPISERLGRLPKIPRARIWAGIAAVLYGGVFGGVLAALQMGPNTNKVIYWMVVGGSFLLALVASAAAATTHGERADSVHAIKTDLDRLLIEGDRSGN